MTFNKSRKKKIIPLIDEKINKYERFHKLTSDQYCKTLECKIEYNERSNVIPDRTMIRMNHGIMNQREKSQTINLTERCKERFIPRSKNRNKRNRPTPQTMLIPTN